MPKPTTLRNGINHVKIYSQQTITDLQSFEQITVAKPVEFTPVTTAAEALARLSGNHEMFIGLLNAGLAAQTRNESKNDPNGWYIVPEGSQSATLDYDKAESFKGVLGDKELFNAGILNMAKSFFGYSKELSAEDKAKTKQQAIDMVKGNVVLLAGVQKNWALKPSADPVGNTVE